MTDYQAFDSLLAATDPAMVIVTTAAGDERAGCLVGFHSQRSINPRGLGIWLSKANHTYRVALCADYLAVHYLDQTDRQLAELFGTTTGDDYDKFVHCDWVPGPDGVPLLSRCANRLLVRRIVMVDDTADHVCFGTELVDAATSERLTPLRLSDVLDLEPGHGNQERPDPSDLTA